MLGLRPKATKTGGLPNITFEPRKPESIGTMLRNCAEVHSGVLVNHQVMKDPMLMHQLQFFDQPSSLPDGAKINDTTAECLRQARAALGDKPDGDGPYPLRFVGGDAWFGGVMSCVELKKRLAVDSTFIIKNHTRMFPKEHLGLVLEARHGGSGESGRRGNWVVMSTEVAGVKLLAVAYAWSRFLPPPLGQRSRVPSHMCPHSKTTTELCAQSKPPAQRYVRSCTACCH